MPDMLRHTTSNTITDAASAVSASAIMSTRRRAPVPEYGSTDADLSPLLAGSRSAMPCHDRRHDTVGVDNARAWASAFRESVPSRGCG